MFANKLKLNDEKTEFIIFGSAPGLKKVNTTSISVGDQSIIASSSIRNIGVFLDSNMKMDSQIKNICKSAWYHLFNIGKIRNYITTHQAKSVVHAYVTSKLDLNNALLAGVPLTITSKLQQIQNAAAKLITRSKKYDHVTPILRELHWLPIHQRILFKLLLMTFKALNGIGPAYLRDLLVLYQPSRVLRSASDPLLLVVPKSRLKTYGDRSFSIVAPVQWNKLPLEIRSCQTVNAFKSLLKTLLFKQHFEC